MNSSKYNANMTRQAMNIEIDKQQAENKISPTSRM
jgi:hypothetical protein